MKHIIIDQKDLDLFGFALKTISDEKFPSVARETLNDLAFDMKKYSVEKTATKEFDYRRNKSFIRSITFADRAKGNNLDTMESWTGVVKRSEKEKVAERMKVQESGGRLEHKFAPLVTSRTAQSFTRPVKEMYTMDELGNYIDVRNDPPNIRFMKMYGAMKMQIPVILKGKRGKGKGRTYIAMPAKRLSRVPKGVSQRTGKRLYYRNKYRIKLRFLYTANPAKNVSLASRPFISIVLPCWTANNGSGLL